MKKSDDIITTIVITCKTAIESQLRPSVCKGAVTIMNIKLSQDLLSFIKNSPTAFHTISNIQKILCNGGYTELSESNAWNIQPEGKYFVKRNDTSIIAFHVGKYVSDYNFNIVASHSDYPTFKIKEKPEIEVKNKYVQLNTEGYGSMICYSWFDRPLSVAGRVVVKDKDCLKTCFVNIDRDILIIPSIAIHMNRQVNDGYSFNKQIDTLPLFGGCKMSKGDFDEMIAKELGVEKSNIYGKDLYVYNRMDGKIWGENQEFISAPHLDDTECAFASLISFISGYNEHSVNVYACFDNEEVGSMSKQGADSTFLYDVLRRINLALNKTEEDYYRAVASGFMISADNAHAVHPNHPEKTDSENCVYINEGVVIKSHAGQKYTSDAVSVAKFRDICAKAGVPVQFFANRSDQSGGSTLGNISTSHVSVNSVDIGLPQLAMHSSYETGGTMDIEYLVKALQAFYSSNVTNPL